MDSKASQGMGRRTFLGAAAALLAGTALGLSGCGEEETGPAGGGDYPGLVDSFDGHRHTVTLTRAQMDAGEAVTLILGETGGHSHTVKLTQAQVQNLQKGGMEHGLLTEADGTSHRHSVHFMR